MTPQEDATEIRTDHLEGRLDTLTALLRAALPKKRPVEGQHAPGSWGHFPLPLAQALWDWAHASDEV